MLDSHRKGYAVMSSDLKSYSFDNESLEQCKRYCYNDSVIAERIPYKIGYSIRVTWHEFHKPFGFRYSLKNILWLHWFISKEFSHKTGKIVYTAGSQTEP